MKKHRNNICMRKCVINATLLCGLGARISENGSYYVCCASSSFKLFFYFTFLLLQNKHINIVFCVNNSSCNIMGSISWM